MMTLRSVVRKQVFRFVAQQIHCAHNYTGSEAWVQISTLSFSSFSHELPSWSLKCMHHLMRKVGQKLLSFKVNMDSTISRVVTSHTNKQTICDRPTLKDIKRFGNGSVCKPYDRSIGAHIFSEFIKNRVVPKELSTGAINSST